MTTATQAAGSAHTAQPPPFNLVDEPWIRVLDAHGDTRMLNLEEVFAQAHQIKRLDGELPTQDFAMLRMLLAIGYRTLNIDPDNPLRSWAALYRTGAFDMAPIRHYLDRWRHRFDLFNAEAPFLQTPGLRNAHDTWKELHVLVPDSPIKKSIYVHRDPCEPIGPAEAARWLVHLMSYDTAGNKTPAVGDTRENPKKTNGPGWAGAIGGLYFRGDTLFDTLMFNTVATQPVTGDAAWEGPVPAPGGSPDPIVYVGLMGTLVWPRRRVRLNTDVDAAGNTRITGALVCNGDTFDAGLRQNEETMSAWRYSEGVSKTKGFEVYYPKLHDPSQALWRGLGGILPHTRTENETTKSGFDENIKVATMKPPAILEFLAELIAAGELDRSARFTLCSIGVHYGPQRAKIDSIIHDELTFAAMLAETDGPAQAAALTAITRTTDALKALRRFDESLNQASSGSKSATGTDRRAMDIAHSRIDIEFRTWLATLTDDNHNRALADWTAALARTIRDIADDLIAAAPPAAWIGRRVPLNGPLRSVGTADKKLREDLPRVLPH